jgi:hypothetical protein
MYFKLTAYMIAKTASNTNISTIMIMAMVLPETPGALIDVRAAFDKQYFDSTGDKFFGEGIQGTLAYSNNGLTIYHRYYQNTVYQKLLDTK